jgi:hypothetical protein
VLDGEFVAVNKMNPYYWYIGFDGKLTRPEELQFNGNLEVHYGMPAFRCCNTRVGNDSGWINADFPEKLRSNREFYYPDYVDVSYEKFTDYREELLNYLELSGLKAEELKRGKAFFPCNYTPPTECSDFASPLRSSLIVTKRVLDVLLVHSPDDFHYRQIHQDYYFIFVKKFGKMPVEQRLDGVTLCPRCGEPEGGRKESRHIFEKDMWPGSSMFTLGDTDHLFFTNDLKQALDQIQATNITYEKIRVGESYNSFYRITGLPTW